MRAQLRSKRGLRSFSRGKEKTQNNSDCVSCFSGRQMLPVIHHNRTGCATHLTTLFTTKNARPKPTYRTISQQNTTSTALEKNVNNLRQKQREEAGGDVIQHDAGVSGEAFKLADRRRLEDVEDAEEKQRNRRVAPVNRNRDQRNQLPRNLVDNDVAGVFAAGLAGDNGGCGNAD